MNRFAVRGRQFRPFIGDRTDAEASCTPWAGTYAVTEGTGVFVQATAIDGLGMLVDQGAIAFELWTGERASITSLRPALAEAFA